MDLTTVIFRVWRTKPSAGVIALFPEIPASTQCWYNCLSYEHVGQHGAADPWEVIRATHPASFKEYVELYQELERIGYNLKVRRRQTKESISIRRTNWKTLTQTVR